MAGTYPLAELRALFWRRPAFARVFAADLVSQVGDGSLVVLFPLLILNATNDVTLTGLAFSGEILALAALSPLAGWVADRLPQRRLMVGAHAARLVLFAMLALVLGARPGVAVLLTVSVALGAAGAFFGPARAALVRRLLEGDELQQAIALEGTMQFLVRLVAPGLMGLVLARFPVQGGLVAVVACYAFAILILLGRGVTPRLEVGVEEKADWREGWRLVGRDPLLRELLALDVSLTLAGMAAFSMLVALLQTKLGLPVAANGWLIATTGLMGAVGAQVAGRLTRKGQVATLTLFVAMSYLAVPFCHALGALMAVWAFRGLAIGTLGVLINRAIAEATPAEAMGRVHAAWSVACFLAAFAGTVLTPIFLRTVGAGHAYALLGAGLLGAWCLVRAARWLPTGVERASVAA